MDNLRDVVMKNIDVVEAALDAAADLNFCRGQPILAMQMRTLAQAIKNERMFAGVNP